MEEVCEGKEFSFRQQVSILRFWLFILSFETQLKCTESIDGQSFATGLPHYGCILVGTVKDVATLFSVVLGKANGAAAKEVKAMSRLIYFHLSNLENSLSAKVILCQEGFQVLLLCEEPHSVSFVISIAKPALVFDTEA